MKAMAAGVITAIPWVLKIVSRLALLASSAAREAWGKSANR